MNSDQENYYVSYDEMECPAVRQLSDYWLSLCGDRPMPLATEFDLVQFPEYAPWIAIVDVLDDGADFQFRLVGTMVVRIFDGDLTGVRLSAGGREFVEGRLMRIYKYAFSAGGATWGGGRVGNVGGRVGFESDVCLLPLADENGNIIRLIHMIRLRKGDGEWID